MWTIIAESILGNGDKAVQWYKMLTPIEHARTKESANKYKVEPYVISADIYGTQNLAGTGGWTWYTGSSSWYFIAGIQYILGLKIEHNAMSINPCIPKDWDGFSIRYKFCESIYNIKVANISRSNSETVKVVLNGEKIENKIPLDGSGKIYNIEVEI